MTRWGHRRLRRQLDAYVDGETAPPATSALRAHLHDCPDCAAHVRLLRAVRCSLVRLGSRRRARPLAGAAGR